MQLSKWKKDCTIQLNIDIAFSPQGATCTAQRGPIRFPQKQDFTLGSESLNGILKHRASTL